MEEDRGWLNSLHQDQQQQQLRMKLKLLGMATGTIDCTLNENVISFLFKR